MAHRVRRTLLIVVVVLTTLLVVLVVSTRPGLRNSEDSMDHTWRELVKPLDARYAQLEGIRAALAEAGEGDREVTHALEHQLSEWELLRASTNYPAQVLTADQLESLAARAKATVKGTDRLETNAKLLTALANFDEAVPNPRLIETYNETVEQYEHNRTASIRRIVASLDGYSQRSTLQLVTP